MLELGGHALRRRFPESEIGDPCDPVDEGEEGRGRRGRIRCPRCAWQPRATDRWFCTCLCSWNAFETGGVCPRCARRWEVTQCLRCEAWSPHRDWYDAG